MHPDRAADPRTLAAVLDAFPCPTLIVDVDRRVRAANGAFQARLGSGTEAVGAYCFEVLHGRRRPCSSREVSCPLVACTRTGRATPALHSHSLGSDLVDEHILLRPIVDDDGAIVACLATFRAESRLDVAAHPKVAGQAALAVAPVRDRLPRLARDLEPVLLVGEPGTGKWCVARAIHSLRGPGAAYEERSSFGLTAGALRACWGSGGSARGATLYLRDVHALELRVQDALADLLERAAEGTRLIAGTDRDLGRRVASGRFREDLRRRLASHVLRLPPLRDRTSDLRDMAATLLRETGGARAVLTDAAFERIRGYSFPGNLDEMARALRHACMMARGGSVDAEHLPDWVKSGRRGRPSAPGAKGTSSLATPTGRADRAGPDLRGRTRRGSTDR